MSPADSLRSAWGGVIQHKLRAVLTTLGVVIGVAAVIAMLALGNGARAAVEANFRFLGSDVIQITARTEIDQGDIVPVGEILSLEDGLFMPEAVPLVRRVEMSAGGTAKVRHGRAVRDLLISGLTAEGLSNIGGRGGLQPVNWTRETPWSSADLLAEGRYFTPAEVLSGLDVCLLGHQAVLDLFQGDSPVDEVVWVNRKRCRVVGMLVELETVDPTERGRRRPNETVYLPISTAIRYLYDRPPSVEISAIVVDEAQMRAARDQIFAYLRARHGIEKDEDGVYQDDFQTLARQDVLGAQLAAARTFALLLAALASVSLVVGGIGIMNVMLVNVVERTREIGIRLAVGARPRDIVTQFLLEAALLSTAGGVLGVAAGVASIPLAAVLNQGVAVLAPASIPLSLAMVLLVGLGFGLYPAVRASRLDPIEALRYE